jgi:hypothetical protein
MTARGHRRFEKARRLSAPRSRGVTFLDACRSTVPTVDPARSLAIGRTAVGAALVAFPRLSAATWIGAPAAHPAAGVLTRALGAREIGLGLGLMTSLDRGRPLRPWLAAGIIADATDLLATLSARDHLPKLAVPAIAVAAGSGIAIGAAGIAGADS